MLKSSSKGKREADMIVWGKERIGKIASISRITQLTDGNLCKYSQHEQVNNR